MGACKNIPDAPILQFLADHQGRWATHGDVRLPPWAAADATPMPTVQDAMPRGTPYKLQLAKMRMLLRRDLVNGCPCGCRGDWEITDKGLKEIGRDRTAPKIR